MTDTQTARDQGSQPYLEGKSFDSNPYSHTFNFPCWQAWTQGWDARARFES